MTSKNDKTQSSSGAKPTNSKPVRPTSPTVPRLREGQANTDPTNIYIKKDQK